MCKLFRVESVCFFHSLSLCVSFVFSIHSTSFFTFDFIHHHNIVVVLNIRYVRLTRDRAHAFEFIQRFFFNESKYVSNINELNSHCNVCNAEEIDLILLFFSFSLLLSLPLHFSAFLLFVWLKSQECNLMKNTKIK